MFSVCFVFSGIVAQLQGGSGEATANKTLWGGGAGRSQGTQSIGREDPVGEGWQGSEGSQWVLM